MATKEEIVERIEIMQAWVDGEEIETTSSIGRKWQPLLLVEPHFDFEEYKYRIKLKPREIWVAGETILIRADEIEAYLNHHTHIGVTKYREVLDDEE